MTAHILYHLLHNQSVIPMNDFIKGWQRVDLLELPDAYISYLETAQKNPQFQQVRQDICQIVRRLPSGIGVDVGCGLGLAVQELTEQGYQVTGIDLSQTMVDEASRRYPNLDFRVGSVLDLPFDDGTLDFYRGERIYVQLPKQQVDAALAEAYRVLKPGGMIVFAEPDLETIVLTCSEANRGLARKAIMAMAENANNGRAGSDLRGQLAKTGFTDVSVTGRAQVFTELRLANPMVIDLAFEAALTTYALSHEQIDLLRHDLNEHEGRHAFLCSCTAFIISARRP